MAGTRDMNTDTDITAGIKDVSTHTDITRFKVGSSGFRVQGLGVQRLRGVGLFAAGYQEAPGRGKGLRGR